MRLKKIIYLSNNYNIDIDSMNILDKISKKIENKAKMDIKSLFMLVSLIILCSTLFGFFSRVMTFVLGFIYPSYASYKAIESSDKEDDTAWLTYWVVFSFVTVCETFTDPILSWFPLYYTVKLCFIISLLTTKMTNTIYQDIISPIFEQKKINKELLKKIKKMIKSEVDEYKIADFLKSKIGDDNLMLQLIINQLFQYTNSSARKIASILATDDESDSDF